MKELHEKIGKLLQMERTRRQIDLENLATDLKISEANLEAIEDGDASRLPSELYFKLFAKSYAEALGIDFEATVEAIEQDLSEVERPSPAGDDEADKPSPKTPPPKTREDSAANGSRRQVRKLLYLIAAVVVLFLIVVVVNEFFLKETDSQTGADSTVVRETETPAPPSTESNQVADYDWNVPAYRPPDSMTLVLVARAASWASVLADGDTAIYRTLTPGRRYEVKAKHRIRVSVGVPSVVTTELNGQPVNLRNPESGRIAGVEVDQVNLEKFLARPLVWAPTSAGQPVTPPVEPSAAASSPGDDDAEDSGNDSPSQSADNQSRDST